VEAVLDVRPQVVEAEVRPLQAEAVAPDDLQQAPEDSPELYSRENPSPEGWPEGPGEG